MELELKHLAPYLPYGLKCLDEKAEPDDNIFTLESVSIHKTVSDNDGNIDILFTEIKPILRPLSNLIDNILDDNNDANYQLSCELAELLNTNGSTYFVKALIEKKYYAVDVRLWNDIETWLNKNHFDWKYNLIPNNLAIDANTLK